MGEFDGVKEPFMSALNPSVRTCVELIRGMVDAFVRDEEERRKRKGVRRRSSGLKRSLSAIRQKLASPSMQDVRKQSIGGSKGGGSLGSSMHIPEGGGSVGGSRSLGTLDRTKRSGLETLPEGRSEDWTGDGAVAGRPSRPKKGGIFAVCCGGGDDDVSPIPTSSTTQAKPGWSEEALASPPLDPTRRASAQHSSGNIVPNLIIATHPPPSPHQLSPQSTSTADLTPAKPATTIDVERHLAAMHRHFASCAEQMVNAAQTEDEKAAVAALNDAVRELLNHGTSEERKRMRMEQLKLVGAIGERDMGDRASSSESDMDEPGVVPSLGGKGLAAIRSVSFAYERVKGMEKVEEKVGASEDDLADMTKEGSL